MKRYFMGITVFGIFCAGMMCMIESSLLQQGIAKEIIRFHVLAESNSEEDQEIKMKVKESVVSYLEPVLAEAATVQESRRFLMDYMEEITETAEQTLRSENQECEVSVGLETVWFPEKQYGDCCFPAGPYEALQVKIGEAKGRNWWCVLYPGLCFSTSVRAVVPEESKEKLRHVLTDEQMDRILQKGNMKVRFRCQEALEFLWH